MVGFCVLRGELLLFVAGKVDLEIRVLGECPCVVDDRLVLLERGGPLDRRFDIGRLAGERESFAVFRCDLALEPITLEHPSNNGWLGHRVIVSSAAHV